MGKFRWIVVFLLPACLFAVDEARATQSARQRVYRSDMSIRVILARLLTGLTREALDPHGATGQIGEFIDNAVGEATTSRPEPLKLARALWQFGKSRSFEIDDLKIDRIEFRVNGRRLFVGAGAGVLGTAQLALIVMSDANPGTARAVPGSLRLNYRARYKRWTILRETLIEDGRVQLTTTVFCPFEPLAWVTLVSDARQTAPPSSTTNDRTCIRNTLSGCVPIGLLPVGPITAVVRRKMNEGFDRALYELERDVKQIVANGETSLVTVSELFIQRFTEPGRDFLRGVLPRGGLGLRLLRRSR